MHRVYMCACSEEDRLQWIESLTVQNLMSFEEETDSTSLTWGLYKHKHVVFTCICTCLCGKEMEPSNEDTLITFTGLYPTKTTKQGKCTS